MGRRIKSVISLVLCFLCVQLSSVQGEGVKAVKGSTIREESPFTWTCRNSSCIKVETTKVQPDETPLPVEVCKLNCGEFGSLWPKPTGKVELGKNFLGFYPQNVIFQSVNVPSNEVKALIDEEINIFKEYLLKTHPDYQNDGVSLFPIGEAGDPLSKNYLLITIGTVWTDKKVTLAQDESYVLSQEIDQLKSNVSVSVMANTYLGARHALETLSQLIAYDEVSNCLRTLDSVTISDKPFYSYRGVLIDTSRNFISLGKLRQIIDGLSYNKLNMLHWHITDTHSFPFVSKSVPEMSKYGAYSPRETYSVEDVAGLIEYGRVRGVKIVPEFDAPAHTGNGWQWGPDAGKGNMALCINKEPWASWCVEPPCGQLNPANENMYEILGKIYGDMMDLFDNELFHMGGDEVKLDCWLEDEEITAYLAKQGKNNTKESLIELWSEFQARAFGLVDAARKDQSQNLTAILWTSELVSVENIVKNLPKDKYVVQIWSTGNDPVVSFVIKNGYRAIFSNYDALYLDCGYGAWIGTGNNWCSPYKGWQVIYENNPMKLLSPALTEAEIQAAYAAGQLLGGEAALWAEQVDDQTIIGKLWPRLSALAERLWSNPATNWYAAETRMLLNRQRHVRRGLAADRLQPEWCFQNEELCYG